MFDDVFDDISGDAKTSSSDVRPTSSDGASDEDHVSVCSLDDDGGVPSSRPRCLSTSMGVSGGLHATSAAAAAAQCISVSTDQLWGCVLSLASAQDCSVSAANVAAGGGHVVRGSRSQENYIDMTDMICVDINIDESVASSVEALHYHRDVILRPREPCSSSAQANGTASTANTDTVATATTNALRTETSSETSDVIDQTCDELKSANRNSNDVIMTLGDDDDDDDENDDNIILEQPSELVDAAADESDVTDGDDDEPSVSRPKDADRPSAARLAKRLYHLDGFRRSDISPHLNKKNSFSKLVGEEYLKYFDFSGEPLDHGFRRFLQQVTVVGDSQECDRVLGHFSRRYHQCNPTSHISEDSCHTLVCAMMLLNNNLHIQNLPSNRRMTLIEFITNLSEMNGGEDFPKDVLKTIYSSIKSRSLQFTSSISSNGEATPSTCNTTQSQQTAISVTSTNDHVIATDSAELKKGYVMRKCCFEPDGRKTALGRRYWKMYYMTLRDMTLYFHNDERGFERGPYTTNAIRLEHALATKAADYSKKKHVLRLQTVDLAQYLIQTSDSRECQEWIDAINLVAACYSAPAHSSHVTAGSTSQRRSFQRPTLSSTIAGPVTTLTLKEQVGRHHQMAVQLEHELIEFRRTTVDKPVHTKLLSDCTKMENYLRFELKRYRTYVRLLRAKLSTLSPTDSCLDDSTSVSKPPRRTHKQSPS